MKECKVLLFEVNDYKHQLKAYEGSDGGKAWDFPEIEKFLTEYLKSGFQVKNMSETEGSYSFYMERDV